MAFLTGARCSTIWNVLKVHIEEHGYESEHTILFIYFSYLKSYD